MDRNVTVLFRLGKALRYGNADDFFQQYDALMEHESLSDYALMNHKEMVRQISELNSEDFSLLQSAVSEKENSPPTTLHVHLEVEDLEDSSVSEQLDRLLESLRLSSDVCGSDSGALSDLENSWTGQEGKRSSSISTCVLDTCHDSGSDALEDTVTIPLVGELRHNESSPAQGHDDEKKECDHKGGCKVKRAGDVQVNEANPQNGQTVRSKPEVMDVRDAKIEHESRLHIGLKVSTAVAGHFEEGESELMSEGGPFITQRRRKRMKNDSRKSERKGHSLNHQTPKQGTVQETRHRSTSRNKSKTPRDIVSGSGPCTSGPSPRPGTRKGHSVGQVQPASNLKLSYAKVAGLAQVASGHERPPQNIEQLSFNYSEIVEFLWNGWQEVQKERNTHARNIPR